ncbi:hypothetical protein L6164_011064 [Bauhinia variegata]|uniref:Uncharacterized protein n=1 Tax=Bauhinia variegata TaxID=167791 RepID=A0ACB9P5G4_BAUVA|nr:hypothetical protein L6164_011064 [Bauhinia variegata]
MYVILDTMKQKQPNGLAVIINKLVSNTPNSTTTEKSQDRTAPLAQHLYYISHLKRPSHFFFISPKQTLSLPLRAKETNGNAYAEIEAAQMMQGEEASRLSPSPSFSSYSSEALAEITNRVIQEFRTDHHSVSDRTLFASWDSDVSLDDLDGGGADDNDDFEFAFVCREPESSPVSADDIFYNGQIRPVYPVFDRNFLFGHHPGFAPRNDSVAYACPAPTAKETSPAPVRRHRLPLRKLMFEERETGSSTSEANGDGLTPGTYCMWSPKSAAKPCDKSNSTGSASKRWKLRDLLIRSQGEGKEQALLFLTPGKRSNKVVHDITNSSSADKNVADRTKSRATGTAKDGDLTKRKSFLPSRQELVGIFNNVNGLGRNLHPF